MKMKTRNSSGFTHHLLLIAVGVLLIGAIGFAGLRVYKQRDIKAKAEQYIPMGGSNVLNATACAVGSAGKVSTVKVFSTRKNTSVKSVTASIKRGTTTLKTITNPGWYGAYNGITFYGNYLSTDQLYIVVPEGGTTSRALGPGYQGQLFPC